MEIWQKHCLSWGREDKLIGLTRGNRSNFSQKEDIPVPEAMNWPPLKERWGSAVPAAGMTHTALCMQSPLQLLKQCLHTGVVTLVSPLSLEERRSASSKIAISISLPVLTSSFQQEQIPTLFPFVVPSHRYSVGTSVELSSFGEIGMS